MADRRLGAISLNPGPMRALANFFGILEDAGGELKCNASGCERNVKQEATWGMSISDIVDRVSGG